MYQQRSEATRCAHVLFKVVASPFCFKAFTNQIRIGAQQNWPMIYILGNIRLLCKLCAAESSKDEIAIAHKKLNVIIHRNIFK